MGGGGAQPRDMLPVESGVESDPRPRGPKCREEPHLSEQLQNPGVGYSSAEALVSELEVFVAVLERDGRLRSCQSGSSVAASLL